jgi:hypothetical protein
MDQEKAPGARHAPEAKDKDDDSVNCQNHFNTNGNEKQLPSSAERFDETINFLEQLRAGGPWVLTAIIPDKQPNEPPTITSTAHSPAEIESFCCEHNGKRNLYYSVNPTRGPMSKKASKADIAAIEYLLGDLDPKSDETSEQAKARYLTALESFEPRATATIDSGNGIQGLWKLGPFIPLGTGSEAIIADAEARSAALMERLGAKAGTQNIDRILRLPGTINLPNAVKRKAGRVECPTKLIMFNGASYSLDSFPLPQRHEKQDAHEERAESSARPEGEDELEWTIRHCDVPVHQRSEKVWWVVNELLRRNVPASAIVSTLLDHANKISAHIYDQPTPRQYAERQVAKAKAKYDKDHPHQQKRGSKTTRKPVEFIGWRTGPPPPIEYLIDRMIKRRGAGVIGGQPKDGKSLIAANLTASALTGQSFAGRLTTRTGGVLWLLNEGQDEIDDNVQQAVRAMGGNMDNQPILRVEGAQYLQEPDAEEWLDSIIKAAKARLLKDYGVELVLVIIDTIISVGAYEDDNSRALTAAVMQKVHNVSVTNDLFSLAVDHVGKDKKRGIMGSIGKIATADVVLLVDVTKKNDLVVSRKMILHMMRGGKAGTVNFFSLKETPENEHGDVFVTVEWSGVEQVNLSSICNLLLRCITECVDPGNLFNKKDVLKVKEENARVRFYKTYGGDSDEANRSAYRRAKAQATVNGLIKAEGGFIWLV